MAKCNKLKRPNYSPKSTSKKIFHIASEGRITEPKFFQWLGRYFDINIKMVRHQDKSCPQKFLPQMKAYIRRHYKKGDECWIVIDKDEWTENQIQFVRNWSKENQDYFFAISNPKFEYYLLLHFATGNEVNNAAHCDKLLNDAYNKKDAHYQCNKYFPSQFYEQTTSEKTKDLLCLAIKRAKDREKNKCKDNPFYSDVYRLVEKIISEHTPTS